MVMARLDLTECGRIAPPAGMSALDAENVTVRIFPPDASYDERPHEECLAAALDAIGRCRLIAEGHVMTVDMKPAVSAAAFLDVHSLYLPAEGTEIIRNPAHPTAKEAHRG